MQGVQKGMLAQHAVLTMVRVPPERAGPRRNDPVAARLRERVKNGIDRGYTLFEQVVPDNVNGRGPDGHVRTTRDPDNGTRAASAHGVTVQAL